MKIKRVLHIITDLNTGGAEMMLYKILHYFNEKDLELYVIVLMGESALSHKYEELGININYLNLKKERILGILSFFKLYNYAKIFRPDIIQGWMYHSNIAAFFLKLLLPSNTTIYWNIRQTLYNIEFEKSLSQLVIKISAFFSRYINTIIYNSAVSKEQHEQYGFDKSKSLIIYNGFDVNIFKPNPSAKQKIRQKYSIPEDEIIIGHIARFHPMKNHKMVIQLASKILRENNNVWFLLIGKNVDNNNKELVDLIKQYNITSRLLMLGEQLIISDLLSSFDIALCLSSWGEGFPNVIGEAMSSGIPVITTDVGDSKMVVDKFGSVVQPNDLNDAIEKINHYLNMNQSKRIDIGSKGRDYIINHFKIEDIGEEYYNIYSIR